MNKIVLVNELKKEHDNLYASILQKKDNLSPEDREAYLQKIEKLIADMQVISEITVSFDDYRWLSDTAIKWQSVFSTFFEQPRVILLSQPKEAWRPQVPQENEEFSEKAIEEWLRRQAAFTAYVKRVESGGQYIDISDDKNWHEAEVFFAFEIIEGKINFANCISQNSYWRLENIWLREVKLIMAYLDWMTKEKKKLFVHHEKDFFCACNHIRKDLLINKDLKAPLSEFKEIVIYIKKHYVGEDGKILLQEMKEGDKLHNLIKNKANRIYKMTGEKDEKKNWCYAETYIKMFYENIIPAVIEKDREKVLRVLKALQYSKINRFLIINCFETCLAIYFLDQNIIKTLWEESRGKENQESTIESIVHVKSWPQNFTLTEPCKSRFWFDQYRIGFRGVMLSIEKKALLKAVTIASHSEQPKEEHKQAIEALYNQSRLIHEETTL